MKKITCDGCNCELSEETAFGVVVGGTVQESFDLCGNCREALIDFLANRQERNMPVETNKDEEDRLYEGPKNDKNAYTIYQLEKMLHKYRGGIKKILGSMKKEPVAWTLRGRPVVKWFLGEADMKELKQRLGVN